MGGDDLSLILETVFFKILSEKILFQELLITELLLDNKLQYRTTAEIAAMLSATTCQYKAGDRRKVEGKENPVLESVCLYLFTVLKIQCLFVTCQKL